MTPVESFFSDGPASLRAWFLASVCKTEPRLQFGQEPSGFSCDEFLIGDALARRCDDEAIQPVKGVAFDVPFIEPKGELVDVSVKVFRTRVMVDTMQPTLHHSPNTLYAVRSDVPAHVFARAMVAVSLLKNRPLSPW